MPNIVGGLFFQKLLPMWLISPGCYGFSCSRDLRFWAQANLFLLLLVVTAQAAANLWQAWPWFGPRSTDATHWSETCLVALRGFFLCVCVCVFGFGVFFFFFWPYLRHVEVPRIGVKLELQLPAYNVATATWDLSCICDLAQSSLPDP